MRVFWKKIIVWCLVLSLAVSTNLVFDRGVTARAAEAGETEPGETEPGETDPGETEPDAEQKEQTITVKWDSEVIGDTLDLRYGQEIFLEIETDGDGQLRYSATEEPDEPDTKVLDLTHEGDSGEETKKAGICLSAAGIGTAHIEITAEGTEEYAKAERTITVTVSRADHVIVLSDIEVKFSSEPFALGEEWKTREGEDALTYQSGNEKIAEVDVNGMVTVHKVGSTGITVTAPETTHYRKTVVEIKLTVVTSLPDPVLKSLENQDGSVKVKWNKISGAEGYQLYRKTSSGSWKRIADLKGEDTLTYVDAGVAKGKSYGYRMRAYAASGADISGYSEKKSIRYLYYPTFCLASLSTGNKVVWKKSTGASYYRIYRRENPGDSWKKVKQIASTGAFSWTDTKVSNGKTYYYTIRSFYDVAEDNTSKSVLAPEQSVFYLQSPSIKSFSRKSATKMTVKWGKNAQATGYQIQYARNSLFVKVKTVTVKSNKTVSRTLTGLAKNKTYYVRIRAYKKVGGVNRYSAWTLHKNAKKSKTASKTVLKKKKKSFELRKNTKQTLYKYDTLQGGCTDGTYGYFIMFNRKVDKCKVAKIKLSNLKVVKVSSAMKLDHGNDMAYNPDTKKLVVLHTDPNRKRISILNKGTLKLESTRDIVIPDELIGASDKERKAIKGFSGVAYSTKRKQYVLRQQGSANLIICDKNLNPVSYVKISSPSYQYQGMDITDDYVLLGRSGSNAVSVYTLEGEKVTDIKLPGVYELENIFHVGNQFYTGFYCSHYTTYYTKKKKTVYVRGKKKKVTVKVRHRKYVRDNYIYKLGKI